MTTEQTNKEDLFTRIAQGHLKFETLVTRNSDSLDFQEVSVWDVRAALEAAYEAGRASLKTAR